MVRPNQIVKSTESTLTFLMFGRSESQIKRRVLLLNFPGKIIPVLIRGDDIDKFIQDVSVVTEGMVNRYKVTVNTNKVNDA